MSADKRTPHTDALETLGMIHEHDEKRDAIHLAVIPAKAGEPISPGAHIQYVEGTAYNCAEGKGQGIADPFLTGLIEPGQKFWFVVYPRAIRSLRHVWEHPAFPSSLEEEVEDPKPLDLSDPEDFRVALITADPVAVSMDWVRKWAVGLDITYDEAIEAGKNYIQHGEYLSDGGKFESEYVPEQYWDHFQNITGINVPEDNRNSFFSCSC